MYNCDIMDQNAARAEGKRWISSVFHECSRILRLLHISSIQVPPSTPQTIPDVTYSLEVSPRGHDPNPPSPHFPPSILHLRRLSNRLNHFLHSNISPTLSCRSQHNTHLNHSPPNLLPTLPHPNSHIAQQRRMSHITRITVSLDIGRPFEFRRVGVSGADVAGLELLELLLGAEFVGLGGRGVSLGL